VISSEKQNSEYKIKSDDDSDEYYSEDDEDITIPNHINKQANSQVGLNRLR
jgi:hypothetical protein